MLKVWVAVLIITAVIILSRDSHAYGLTGKIEVRLTVQPMASISVSGMNFIKPPYTRAPYYANATINITAAPDLQYKIAFDRGANNRRKKRFLVSGLKKVVYQIYKDPGYLYIWGDDGLTYPYSSLTGTGTGLPQVITAYGRVKRSRIPEGVYTDAIKITLSY